MPDLNANSPRSTGGPIYFTVTQVLGREVPALYFDYLPPEWRGRRYVLRLDLLPGGAAMAERPIADLYAVYQRLQAQGKLPPAWAPPPPPKQKTTTKMGERRVRFPWRVRS